MTIELYPEALEWRREVRGYLREAVTPELLAEMRTRGEEDPGPEIERFRRTFAERGWNKLTWPTEFGGMDRGEIYSFILHVECEYWRVPRPDLTVSAVAPIIMRYGTRQNQEEFLPAIASGDLQAAIGYSEPNAGTDLMNLQTRADLDGDEWVINGQKIWNSFAHCATHEWLGVRTDRTVPKHRGISIIMVPLDTPGIEIRPLPTWGQHLCTNETFFTNVRVPRTNLIGEINEGARYMTGALDLQRLYIGSIIGESRRALDEMLAFVKAGPGGSKRSLVQASLLRKITQLEAEVQALMLLGIDAAARFDKGERPTIAATALKIAVTEVRQRVADVATQLDGAFGALSTSDPRAVLDGVADELYRATPMLRFGGGANEVMRDLIAQRGHSMPSYR